MDINIFFNKPVNIFVKKLSRESLVSFFLRVSFRLRYRLFSASCR